MSRKHLLLLVAPFVSLLAQQGSKTAEEFDLVSIYQTSTHVFYGEISKVLPEKNFKTGLEGVYLKGINKTELTLEPVIWPRAKVLTVKVRTFALGHMTGSSVSSVLLMPFR